MIRAFLGAVQFLTVLPVHTATAPPGKAALFFPAVGAIVGLAGAVVLEAARAQVPFTLAALFVLTLWALVGGGLHEDGFADCADAMRAGRPRERILEILKDSRIGAHGALALLLFTLIRWQSLSAIAAPDLYAALAAAGGLPRSAAVALAWIAPPAGSGAGFALSQTLRTPVALAAIAQGVALAWWCGGRIGWVMASIAVIVVMAARRYFVARIGGVTGDCLGATAHVVETSCLVVLTCRSCMS